MTIIPTPTSTIKERGIKRMNEKRTSRAGKRIVPIVKTFPLKLNRPSEAINRAPLNEPIPLADWSIPFVVASPFNIFTAHAGSRVLNEKPKTVVNPTSAIIILTTG